MRVYLAIFKEAAKHLVFLSPETIAIMLSEGSLEEILEGELQ